MGTRQPENTRSIAIAAHGGAGKTSLVEAMLFDNGITSRLGKVEDGNTVSDFSQEEQKRKSRSYFPYHHGAQGQTALRPRHPGFADFVGEMRSAIRVADSLLIAVSGVTASKSRPTRPGKREANSIFPPRSTSPSLTGKTPTRQGPERYPVRLQRQGRGGLSARRCGSLLQGSGGPPRNKAYIYETNGSGKFTEGDIPADMADEAAQARESLGKPLSRPTTRP